MSLEVARNASHIQSLIQRMGGDLGGNVPQVHQDFIHALIGTESNFGEQERNPHNRRVLGAAQFTESTFTSMLNNMKANGTPKQQDLADLALERGRDDDYAQIIATYAYSLYNAQKLKDNSLDVSPITLNAMHVLGEPRGPAILKHSDDTLISTIPVYDDEGRRISLNSTIAQNGNLFTGTVGEMKAEIERRLGSRGHNNPREMLAFGPDGELHGTGRNMSYTAVASAAGISAGGDTYASASGFDTAGLRQGAEEAWNTTTGAVSGAASWLTAGSLQNSQGEWFRDEFGELDWKKGLGAGALLILFFAALDWAKEKTGLLLGLIAGVAIMAFAAFGGSRLFGVGTAHAAEPNPLPGHGTGAPVPQRGDGVKPLELPEELRNTNVSGGTDLPNHQRVDPNAPHRPASDGIDGLSLPG